MSRRRQSQPQFTHDTPLDINHARVYKHANKQVDKNAKRIIIKGENSSVLPKNHDNPITKATNNADNQNENRNENKEELPEWIEERLRSSGIDKQQADDHSHEILEVMNFVRTASKSHGGISQSKSYFAFDAKKKK